MALSDIVDLRRSSTGWRSWGTVGSNLMKAMLLTHAINSCGFERGRRAQTSKRVRPR